jgi:hypothetical protein
MDYLLLRRMRIIPFVTSMMDDPESYDELFWLVLRQEIKNKANDKQRDGINPLRRLMYHERHRAIVTGNVQLLIDNLNGNSAAAAAYDGESRPIIPHSIKLAALKSRDPAIMKAIFPKGMKRRDLYATMATENELLGLTTAEGLANALECMSLIRPEDITDRLIARLFELAGAENRFMRETVGVFCCAGNLELVKMCVARGCVLKQSHMRSLCGPDTICKENLLWLVESGHLPCIDGAIMWCVTAGRVDLAYWALRAGYVRDIGAVYICAIESKCVELAEFVWPRSKRNEALAAICEAS